MYRGFSVAFLVVGALLIFWGIRATESFNSQVSEFFTDSPSDKAIWLLIGGIAAGCIGLFGMFSQMKTK